MKEISAFVAKLLTLHRLKIFPLYFTKYSPCKRCSVGPRSRNPHRTNTHSISSTNFVRWSALQKIFNFDL